LNSLTIQLVCCDTLVNASVVALYVLVSLVSLRRRVNILEMERIFTVRFR
jgi:hypothetical protein